MKTFLASNQISIPEIHFAPLQGFTDIAYYTAFYLCFGSADYYYTPYFSIEDNLTKASLDIPDFIFNQIVPQVLPANIAELKLLMDFVIRNNFSEINLNLGCPYPMVTRKGRGANLISSVNKVAEFIDYIHDNSALNVSIKTRLGLTEKSEIFNLFEAIAGKNVKSVILHPRTASQLYSGEVSIAYFQKCKILFPNLDLIYNGDIIDLKVFNELQELISDQQKWMIGRGFLSNPFLAGMMKEVNYGNNRDQNKLLQKFIFKLIEEIENDSKNNGHALNRIKVQFKYLSNAFPFPERISRYVRRIKSPDEFIEFIREEFSNLNDDYSI